MLRLWTKFYLAINEKIPERKQKQLFRLPVVSRVVKKKILTELGLNHVRAAITSSTPLSQHMTEWYRGLGLELLGQHNRLGATCVTGFGQPQPFALLMLSAYSLQSTLLEALLKRINASLEDHEKLAHLVVVKDQWSRDNGYLTPTMKIKRNVIEERYLPQAEAWRRSRQAVIWEA